VRFAAVCRVAGAVFYKFQFFKSLFEFHFYENLNGDRKRYVKFTEIDQSSLVGAALAALID
jgi:hexokinase